jgi:hypothetical protein
LPQALPSRYIDVRAPDKLRYGSDQKTIQCVTSTLLSNWSLTVLAAAVVTVAVVVVVVVVAAAAIMIITH